MPLELLNIYNARNIKELSFKPSNKFNIIYGVNGSGKTTILESIYFLLRARIFRNNKYKSFINFNNDCCTIFSKFCSSNTDSLNSSSSFNLGISRLKDNSQPLIHLNKTKVSSLSQISNLAILGLITSESFNLLDSGPSIRRKFLDWGVFHVEHQFIHYWKSYRKILNNRNNLLKNYKNNYHFLDGVPKNLLNDLNCWTQQLIDLNDKLNLLRSKQLNNINNDFRLLLYKFSDNLYNNITIEYYQGWTSNISFEEYLKTKLKNDISSGYTRYGTHRSDILIKYQKRSANDILSRGQKKIIIICLILAQFNFLKNINKLHSHNILLLDDMDSELDQKNLNILLTILYDLDCQIIMTTTDKDKYINIKENYELFHVEQGGIKDINI